MISRLKDEGRKKGPFATSTLSGGLVFSGTEIFIFFSFLLGSRMVLAA